MMQGNNEAIRSRRAEPTRWNAEDNEELKLRRKEDSVGRHRRERDSMLSGSYQSPNNESSSRSVLSSTKGISVTLPPLYI